MAAPTVVGFIASVSQWISGVSAIASATVPSSSVRSCGSVWKTMSVSRSTSLQRVAGRRQVELEGAVTGKACLERVESMLVDTAGDDGDAFGRHVRRQLHATAVQETCGARASAAAGCRPRGCRWLAPCVRRGCASVRRPRRRAARCRPARSCAGADHAMARCAASASARRRSGICSTSRRRRSTLSRRGSRRGLRPRARPRGKRAFGTSRSSSFMAFSMTATDMVGMGLPAAYTRTSWTTGARPPMR